MRFLPLASALMAAGVLVACGGDSSSDAAPAPTQPSTPTAITLTGVVAKGAALAGASVEAKCATGTATTTANATGGYTITITGGALPCVLEAVGIGADANIVLHSVAAGSATDAAATSNITPLTELLVAQLTGQDPAAYMDSVSASAIGTAVTGTAVTTAQTAVLATLESAGVDTAAITNLVSGALVPAAGGTAGNGYDQVLDALAATIASTGTSLAQLTESVAASSPAAPPVVTQPETPTGPSLPANLLLSPKASNCDALRSGRYRIVKFAATNGAANAQTTAFEDFTLDAEALTATFSVTDVLPLTPHATSDCRYTLPDGGEAVVSQAGVIVVRNTIGNDDDTVAVSDRGVSRMMIAMPIQDIALADLAGEWAAMGIDRNPLAAYGGYLNVNATGVVENLRCWDDAFSVAEANCAPVDSTYSERISKNASGTFMWGSAPNDPDQWADTLFAYRAGNGDILAVVVTDSGEPAFAVKRRTLGLPAVGFAYSNFNVSMGNTLVAGAVITESSHEVMSVDAAAGTVVRNSVDNGAAAVQQTLAYNAGRPGYIARPAGVARPFEGLALPAFGLTAIYLPSTVAAPQNNAAFSLSIRK